MRCTLLVSSLLFILAVVVAPPGLCPCWLMAEPGEFHPHLDGRPELPHSHEYLFDLFQSQTVSAVPLVTLPVSLLMLYQAAKGLWRRLADPVFFVGSWTSRPLTPPPRP